MYINWWYIHLSSWKAMIQSIREDMKLKISGVTPMQLIYNFAIFPTEVVPVKLTPDRSRYNDQSLEVQCNWSFNLNFIRSMTWRCNVYNRGKSNLWLNLNDPMVNHLCWIKNLSETWDRSLKAIFFEKLRMAELQPVTFAISEANLGLLPELNWLTGCLTVRRSQLRWIWSTLMENN